MKRKKLLLLLFLFSVLKTFSQTNNLDPIADTGANYLGNVAYNIGEVYVIYTIQNNQIVSKQSDEIVTDTNEVSASQSISIYPNPVTNILTFKTTDDKKVSKIWLYSMDGKIILDRTIENNEIDLTNLLQGTYILKTDFDNCINFKIIKR